MAEVILHNATLYSNGTQESLVYEVTLETEQMSDGKISFVSLCVGSNMGCPSANWNPKAHIAGCDLSGADLNDARFGTTICPDRTVTENLNLSHRCSAEIK